MPTTNSAFTPFQDLREQLGRGQHDFGSDTFKVAFTNTAPSLSNATLSDITEISAGGGYSAGGLTLTGVTWSETAVTINVIERVTEAS